MKRAFRASVPAVFALLLLSVSTASAQSYGRYILTLESESGEPLSGVAVTATCAELPQFTKTVETDKKGRATFTFVDATKQYLLKIADERYVPAEFTVKAAVRGVSRQTVALPEVGTAPPPEPEPAPEPKPAKLTPAQETFNEGVVALQSEDLATAEAKFQAALAIDPELAPAHSGLAGIYLAQGKAAEALASTQKVLDAQPDDPRGLRMAYEAHNALGNVDEAKAMLAKLSALGEGGDAATLIYNEGVAALKVGDRATARAKFQEAVEIDSTLNAARVGLATVVMGDKEYAEAAALAEEALAAEPGNLQALRVRFDAYRNLENTPKADEALAALTAADPDGVFDWLYDTGVELFDAGDMQGAAKQLESATKLRPEDPNVLYRLGLAYVNLDRKGPALQYLEKFLEVKPDHPEAPVAREMIAYLK